MPYYLIPSRVGTNHVKNNGDGYSVSISWFRAYPSLDSNSIAHNIYYSSSNENVFSEGAKFVYDGYELSITINDLIPGQLYYFAVRPIEYTGSQNPFLNLPQVSTNLYCYPRSILRQDISSESLTIPLVDSESFPNSGVIRVGAEAITYSTNDIINSDLILNNISQRGTYNSPITIHNTDGYDGYHYYDNEVVYYVPGESTQFDRIYMCQCRFEFGNYQMTIPDGYHQETKDLLTSDLSGADAANADFPSYDYVGWHRPDPRLIFNGTCVGLYTGGEMFCHDGYSGVGRVVRGFNLQDHILQREEMLLSITGEPVVLLRKQRTGILCSCYLPHSQQIDPSCPKCHGGKFVLGYEQYFNDRRSDGRLLVRFSPADEDIKQYEAGLESELQTEVWSLTVPTIKDRDILVRFQDEEEEFRYEVLSVNRSKTVFAQQGAQKMRVQRIRKYDQAYKIRVFPNTSMFPTRVQTSIGFTTGIPQHSHTFTRNEKLPFNWIQETQASAGHTHQLTLIDGNLVVLPVLGHSHTIII